MSAKKVSVVNCPRSYLRLYMWSDLYCWLSGIIADRTPFCVVASMVALACLGPMCHNLASEFDVRSAWRLWDTKVQRAGYNLLLPASIFICEMASSRSCTNEGEMFDRMASSEQGSF